MGVFRVPYFFNLRSGRKKKIAFFQIDLNPVFHSKIVDFRLKSI